MQEEGTYQDPGDQERTEVRNLLRLEFASYVNCLFCGSDAAADSGRSTVGE